MFNFESFRFWLNVFAGNWIIYICLGMYNDVYDSIKKHKINSLFFMLVAIYSMFLFKLGPREMDIPGLLALRHNEMAGIVCDFRAERKSTDGRVNMLGGTVDIKDSGTGKVYHFRDVRVPSGLCMDDTVKMLYLKHYRMGAVVEINGEPIKYHVDNNKVFGAVLILLLLLSVPVYYFWVFKVKPFFHWGKDYGIYIYRDLYIMAMKVLYTIIILGDAVLMTAVLGYYKTSWDILWGIVLLAGYLGVFGVSCLRQKRFIIMDEKFYYYGFKKCHEGRLDEIDQVKRADNGIVIYAGEMEMTIFGDSENDFGQLLKRLPVKVQEGDGR